ncbi:uncharacterized protein B0I36DRAFT_11479 [Microdochium trichocladiopsis]|uniref:Uncharacterized protein n=1 Tax=Microdochium trichocladiopsis TaxID=1682393 RepID=A0A9P9BU01_9PEZI|nr:uncharacterized protein B0I36DRAFT_11479 [Microdochium trichocladiopsis]KAH7040511.1 hypothetical protein B0I36DRAFT_11479 [Microdochium trichocladiopsis]
MSLLLFSLASRRGETKSRLKPRGPRTLADPRMCILFFLLAPPGVTLAWFWLNKMSSRVGVSLPQHNRDRRLTCPPMHSVIRQMLDLPHNLGEPVSGVVSLVTTILKSPKRAVNHLVPASDGGCPPLSRPGQCTIQQPRYPHRKCPKVAEIPSRLSIWGACFIESQEVPGFIFCAPHKRFLMPTSEPDAPSPFFPSPEAFAAFTRAPAGPFSPWVWGTWWDAQGYVALDVTCRRLEYLRNSRACPLR